MDRKKLVLLLGALVIAIGTALAARSMFAGASAPQAEAAQQAVPQGPKVLVAQRALPVGTIITADSISYQAWPKEMVENAYFIDGETNMEKLLGTVVWPTGDSSISHRGRRSSAPRYNAVITNVTASQAIHGARSATARAAIAATTASAGR